MFQFLRKLLLIEKKIFVIYQKDSVDILIDDTHNESITYMTGRLIDTLLKDYKGKEFAFVVSNKDFYAKAGINYLFRLIEVKWDMAFYLVSFKGENSFILSFCEEKLRKHFRGTVPNNLYVSLIEEIS